MSAEEWRQRAQDAERELQRRRRVHARLLELADAWEATFGDNAIRADFAADVIRRTIDREP